jgi:hypothetical protein
VSEAQSSAAYPHGEGVVLLNELARQQWRHPVEEPAWYYDLHPVARELLGDHGEVPLLLSRHLRSRSRWYDDAPELELRDAAGSPVAEADLIAASDGSRIIAEAKSNNTLGSNPREIKRAAAKRVKLADVLRTCWTFCTPASTLPYSDSATPRSASSPPPTWSSPAASPAASASDGAALLVVPRPARPLGRLWRGRKARDGIDERSPMLANPLARIGVLAG